MSKHEMMVVIKLLLEPDTAVSSTLDGQSRICNWTYNTLLSHAQELRQGFIETQNVEIAKIVYSERGLRNLLPKLKEEHPFMKVVHSSVLKNAALRLSDAIQTHQKSKTGKRKGPLVRWPKYRSWKKSWFSLFYDEPNKGFKIENDQLILSLGMGQERKQRSVSVRIKQAELLKNKEIRNLRIVKQLGLFYAVFTVRKSLPETKPISRIAALDPNHKNLSYGVDAHGNAFEIESPSWLKIYDKRIDELKSKRDRCFRRSKQVEVLDSDDKPINKTYWEPSKRWKKYNQTLQRALQKRREQSKTFLFTIAHRLYKIYDCIGIGNYAPNGNGLTTKMRRAMNNRSLIDRFKQVLSWVAVKSGKTFFEYDEKGTTRTCHCCRHVIEGGIKPHIREWVCPGCGMDHIRDENAAQNGLSEVLRNLAKKSGEYPQVSCSDLASIMRRWAWRVLPGGVFCTLRRQNSESIAASGN